MFIIIISCHYWWQIFILLTLAILNIISMAISLLTSLKNSNELFIENRHFYWLYFCCSFLYFTIVLSSLYRLFYDNELISLYSDIGTCLSILCIIDLLFLSYLFFVEFSAKIKIYPSKPNNNDKTMETKFQFIFFSLLLKDDIFIWPGIIIYIILTLRIIFIPILIHIFNYDLSRYKWNKA